jgi:hypothetical protein
MSHHTPIRLSGLAIGVSGLLHFLVGLAVTGATYAPDTAAVPAGLAERLAPAILGLLRGGHGLEVLGLMGVYAVQCRRAGWLGLLGFVVAEAGLLTTMGPVPNPVGLIVFLVGLLVLSVASTRAGVLPRASMWAWLVGAVVATVAPMLPFLTQHRWHVLVFLLAITVSALGRVGVGIALGRWPGKQPATG